MNGTPVNHRIFIERLAIALVVVGVALLLWNLRGLFMLAFGAVLVAFILNLIAGPVRTRLGAPAPIALISAVLIVAAVVIGAIWTFGAQVSSQAQALRDMIPAAWHAIEQRLASWGLGGALDDWTASLTGGGSIVSRLGNIAVTIGNGLADTLLIVVGGIYLAAQPALYRTGLIKLVPTSGRALAAQALDASARALRLWLLGRLVSMAVVGVTTWLGLLAIGVPSALALGLLAALLEFVPFIGPILSAIPAIMLAFADSPEKAFWTLLLFLVIQQIEGNLLEPLVQQRAVSLPPALLLFALVAGGLLFGAIGVVLASPLAVVLFVMVKRLYVQEALDTETPLPGDKD